MGEARFHRGSNAGSSVNAAEVVPSEVKSQRKAVVSGKCVDGLWYGLNESGGAERTSIKGS